jgi:hypothetical protein
VLTDSVGRPHVYDLLNYASTALGMVLLGWWWWQAVAAGRPDAGPGVAQPLPVRVRAAALATLFALTAAGGVANGLRLRLDGWGLETTVIGAVLGAMAAGLLTVTVLSVALSRLKM